VLDAKIIKLLIVEDDLEDEQILCEALLEIEENRLWSNWRSSSIVAVDQLSAALACLRDQTFDAILLNLSLPDSASLLDSFLNIRGATGAAPVLVLADEPDDNLANHLLREGVQDVLVKSEIDCLPLARAIRHAIERQRRLNPALNPALIPPPAMPSPGPACEPAMLAD
jgi:DNA-binding NarL/FixJ family response regulator